MRHRFNGAVRTSGRVIRRSRTEKGRRHWETAERIDFPVAASNESMTSAVKNRGPRTPPNPAPPCLPSPLWLQRPMSPTLFATDLAAHPVWVTWPAHLHPSLPPFSSNSSSSPPHSHPAHFSPPPFLCPLMPLPFLHSPPPSSSSPLSLSLLSPLSSLPLLHLTPPPSSPPSSSLFPPSPSLPSLLLSPPLLSSPPPGSGPRFELKPRSCSLPSPPSPPLPLFLPCSAPSLPLLSPSPFSFPSPLPPSSLHIQVPEAWRHRLSSCCRSSR